jgi:hypothetical protein
MKTWNMLMLCVLLSACVGPEPVIGDPGDGGGDRCANGGCRDVLPTFEASFAPPMVNHWRPEGCGWDTGAALGTHAGDEYAPWLLITQRGCSIESAPVQVPADRSVFAFTVRTDLQGHACSLYDCTTLTLDWLDANQNLLASTGFDVGPIKPGEPRSTARDGAVPPGATLVVVSVRGPTDMRSEARALFTSLSLAFE